MEPAARPFFELQQRQKMWNLVLFLEMSTAKQALASIPAPNVEHTCSRGLCRYFHGHTGLEPALFPFHPQLFQVKGQRQQEQLCADVGLAPGQKAAESKVVFQQAKGALHLDGAAETQMDSTFRPDIFLCLLPFLPEGLSEYKLLGPVLVLDPAALCPLRAPATIFTPVPGGGYKLSVPRFCGLPPQIQRR